jgi:hypothetical protein
MKIISHQLGFALCFGDEKEKKWFAQLVADMPRGYLVFHYGDSESDKKELGAVAKDAKLASSLLHRRQLKRIKEREKKAKNARAFKYDIRWYDPASEAVRVTAKKGTKITLVRGGARKKKAAGKKVVEA